MSRFRPLEFLIVFLGALIAVGIGSCVSFGDYFELTLIGILLGLIVTPAVISRFWVLGTACCAFSFVFYTIRIPIVPLEICCGFSLYILFFSFWTEKHRPPPDSHLLLLRVACFALVWYLLIHFFWFKTVASPEALRSMVRTYFDYAAPSLVLFILTIWTPRIWKPREPLFLLASILALGTFVNIGMRLWQVTHAHGWGDPTSVPPFAIPGINALENVYALRVDAPTLSLLCATLLFCVRPAPRFLTRLTMGFLIASSFLGAFLSGGRLTVLLIPFYILVILVWQRKFGLVFCMAAACFAGIVLVNVFSDTIERNASPMILRSTYFFIWKKDTRAALSVDSSTEWREELITRSFQEWCHTPMTIVFGRSIKPFNFNYDAAMSEGVGTESLEASIERGHTHCLVTDLLLPFGLIGAVLYLAVQFISIGFLRRFLRVYGPDHPLHGYALFLIIYYSYSLLYGLVAGGYDFFPQWLLLCLILFLSGPPTPPAHDLHRHPQLSPT